MARLLDESTKKRIQNMCWDHGFVSKGQVFFRIHANTILQAISFRYEQVFSHYSLEIGLMSLYSEAEDSVFAAQSSLKSYSICCLENHSSAVYMSAEGEFVSFKVKSPEYQLRLLEKYGFEWLDGIVTQKDLLQAINFLETVSYKSTIWNNISKLAPFLAIDDYDSADFVIASILNQHLGSNSFSSPPWSKEGFLYYSTYYPNKDVDLLYLHDLIATKNENAIKAYLEENYKKNTDRLRFTKRTGDGSGGHNTV